MVKVVIKSITIKHHNKVSSDLEKIGMEGKTETCEFFFRNTWWTAPCISNAVHWLKEQGYYSSDNTEPLVQWKFV